MDTNYYDVVVYGPELSGLIAATLLGRRGLRVLLAGHDMLPNTFQAGPYVLSRESGSLPPPDSEPVARILRELGMSQIVRRRAPQVKPCLQLVFSQHRVEHSTEADVLQSELRREFPSERTEIESVLNRVRGISSTLDPLLGSDVTLPPVGFWERRDVSRIEAQLPTIDTDTFSPLPAEHPLRVGVAALAALNTGYAPLDIGPLSQARTLDLARRGFHRLPAGTDLRELFQTKLSTFSGEAREGIIPSELVFRRSVLTGIRMRPRNETIGFGHLLWATSSSSLLSLCGNEVPRHLRDTATTLRPGCYRYMLCLLMRPEGFPEGMGTRVIAVRDHAKTILVDNAISITVGIARERDADQVPVWVECLVPSHASENIGYLSVVRARLRKELSRLMPFFEKHLFVLASPHDGLAPEFGQAHVASARLPVGPVPPCALPASLSCDATRMMGLAAAPHATGIKNLHLVNSENLPGLGREGDFISAWGAARLLAHPSQRQVGKKREILIEEI